MANIYKRWLCEESLKTPSSRPILIYFEFRSKPSLITVICMDPHSPNKLFATKYCFLILGDDTSFFFFISLFFVFFFTLLLIFTKIIFYYYYFIIVILFHENYLHFFMLRDVPACSGMLRVPAFIEAQLKNSHSLYVLSYSKNVPRECHWRHAAPEDRRAPTLWYYIHSLDRWAERLSGPALPYIHRHRQGGRGVLC